VRGNDANALARRNALLAALPSSELAALVTRMRLVELDIRDQLYLADRPIRSV
jgi:hypothetical protein